MQLEAKQALIARIEQTHEALAAIHHIRQQL